MRSGIGTTGIKFINKFGKAFAELDKAGYYAQQAEIAKRTAEGEKFKDPEYLAKKIKGCQKILRMLKLRIEGKIHVHSEPKIISEEHREFYDRRIVEEKDKLNFLVSHMKVVNPEYSLDAKSSKQKRGKSL